LNSATEFDYGEEGETGMMNWQRRAEGAARPLAHQNMYPPEESVKHYLVQNCNLQAIWYYSDLCNLK